MLTGRFFLNMSEPSRTSCVARPRRSELGLNFFRCNASELTSYPAALSRCSREVRSLLRRATSRSRTWRGRIRMEATLCLKFNWGEHPWEASSGLENLIFYPVTLKNLTLGLTATSSGRERDSLLRCGFTFFFFALGGITCHRQLHMCTYACDS